MVAVYDPAGNAGVYSYDAVGNLLSTSVYPANQLAAFYLSSTNAQPGSSLTIYGTDFCSNPAVTFDGTPATVTSATPTQIVVSVPAGAPAGQVAVNCGSNSVNAGAFGANASLMPSISGFSPANGPPGASVTITGVNEQDVANVLFNGFPALVTSTTSTSVTAVVPSGATSGPIAIISQYGQAVSNASFTVLPAGTLSSNQIGVNGSPTLLTFSEGGQQAILTFSGSAGEEVLFTFTDPQLDCVSSATVQNPDGSTLVSFSGLCLDEVYYGTAVLPTTGVYSIVTNDGVDPGSVSVAVQNVAQLPGISVGGPPVTVNIPVGGTSALAFNANAGDQVSLTASPNGVSFPSISIIAPNGVVLGNTQLTNSGNYQNYIQELNATTLPTTGTYVLFCSSSAQDVLDMNNDNFPVQLYPAPTISGTIAVGGPTVSEGTDVPGQYVDLSFNGTARPSHEFRNDCQPVSASLSSDLQPGRFATLLFGQLRHHYVRRVNYLGDHGRLPAPDKRARPQQRERKSLRRHPAVRDDLHRRSGPSGYRPFRARSTIFLLREPRMIKSASV